LPKDSRALVYPVAALPKSSRDIPGGADENCR
jgi:hypothetical protein